MANCGALGLVRRGTFGEDKGVSVRGAQLLEALGLRRLVDSFQLDRVRAPNRARIVRRLDAQLFPEIHVMDPRACCARLS
jgi:hypothetical protein